MPTSKVDKTYSQLGMQARNVGSVRLTGPMAHPSTLLSPVTVHLEPQQPYDAGSILDFLARRAVPGIEALDGDRYCRTLRLPHGPGAIRLDLTPASVAAHLLLPDERDRDPALERVRWLLDLEVAPHVIESHLARDPHLVSSVSANPGLRVPGHVDGFEVAVRAVVGQQISVVGARTILTRLVGEYGEPFAAADRLTHLFPTPERLAEVDPERLPMPRSRGRALVGVAAAVAAGSVVLDRSVDLAEARRDLLALPGIGPWTADYIALRALGDPDVFMGTDLGVRHGLARMGLDDVGQEVIAGWAPWRSYALMHVWKSLDPEAA